MKTPLSPISQIVYDSLGNVFETVSPLNHKVWFNKDATGRDTTIAQALDSVYVNYLTTRIRYDAVGRDTLTIVGGPALATTAPFLSVTTPAETLTVRKHYNTEGMIDSLSRFATPDMNGIKTATTGYRYDNAYRTIQEIDPAGKVDTYQYDAAGNRTQWTTRRGGSVSYHFDALNRMTQRITAAATYMPDTGALGIFPYAPYANAASGYTIASDIATFAYDPVGHVTSAWNGDAHVDRTYFRDGSIATDSLRIRNYAGSSFAQHVYGLGYRYDLDGRRDTLFRPTNLGAPPPRLVTQYVYDTLTGQLATVTDFYGKQFTYTYDAEERPLSLAYPGQITDNWMYDADGRVIARVEKTARGVGAGFSDTLVHYDRYTYDWRNKQRSIATKIDQTGFAYSAMGNLIRSSEQDTTNFTLTERHDFDALGNPATRFVHSTRFFAPADDQFAYSYEANTGRLLQTKDPRTSSPYIEGALFDLSGNRRATGASTLTTLDNSESYYSAENQLRALDHRRCVNMHPNCDVNSQFKGTFEEYRYDALARRILVRSNRLNICSGLGCVSAIQATIWDGAQVLYELRADGGGPGPNNPGDPSAVLESYDNASPSQASAFYGRAGYTHGLGIDAPLAVERPTGQFSYFIPHTNWQGLADQGTDGAGTLISCTTCIDWPALANDLYYNLLARQEANPDSWSGDLINQKRDISGQIYMRNRYYDPNSGRFTQEDPVGLAGGVNAYGFAAGDPVNYSDPFGLCTPPDSRECQIITAIAGRVAPLEKTLNTVGEVTGVNGLGQAVDEARAGNVGGAALDLALALPVGPGEEVGAAVRFWHKATFATEEASAAYHLAKHGGGRTLAEYTADAVKFFTENKASGVKALAKDGTEALKFRTTGGPGGWFTEAGKIITFWYK